MIPLILRLKKESHKEIAKAQDLIVKELYKVFNDAVLHGGTAIWRCYNGNRFSEDVDVYIKKDEKKLNILFDNLKRNGFFIEKKKISENSLYSNLKFNGTFVKLEALFKRTKRTFKTLNEQAAHKIKQISLLNKLTVVFLIPFFLGVPFIFKRPVNGSFKTSTIFGVSKIAFNNFGIKSGAFGSSVAHDSHNIIAVGTSDSEIAKVVNSIVENKGGLAVSNGVHVLSLPLPVAGLMSETDCQETGRLYSELDKMVKESGSQLDAPFMTLSFMALLVIPKLKLSDKGLFDGEKFEFVSVFV